MSFTASQQPRREHGRYFFQGTPRKSASFEQLARLSIFLSSWIPISFLALAAVAWRLQKDSISCAELTLSCVLFFYSHIPIVEVTLPIL